MDTPTLEKMGIANPDEIARYTLRQKSAREDVLKIHYQRTKGSLLPVSRTYNFGRATRSVVADSGEPRHEQVFEVSPILQAAQAELDALLADKRAGASGREALIAEFDAVLEQMGTASESDLPAIRERLASLRKQMAKG